MALDILAPITEFVGNLIFAAQHRKKQGPFPTISIFGSGLVFILLGGMSALVVSNMAPNWHPLAIVLSVSLGAVAMIIGAQRAGIQLGFLLTPTRCIAYALIVASGSAGALFFVSAL